MSTQGYFIPSSNIWDVSQLYDTNVNDPAFKELLVRLYQNVNNISQLLNIKDTGVYVTSDIVNGQTFFPNPTSDPNAGSTLTNRQVHRLVINVGAIGAGTTSVAHGLTIAPTWTFTRIYGAASFYSSTPTSSRYYPLPTTSLTLYADGTNVNITNSTGISFTSCYVILEYLQT